MRDVEGVKDAAVDVVSMELILSSDGRKIDLEEVMRAVRDAGYEVANKEGP